MPAESGRTHAEVRDALRTAADAGSVPEAMRAAHELLALGRAADIAFCANIFRKLRAALLASGHRGLKVYLVRSATWEPVLPALHVEAVLHGYVLDIMVGGYGSYAEELLDTHGAIQRFAPDLVLVLLDREEMTGNLPELCSHGDMDQAAAGVDKAVGRMSVLLRGFRTWNDTRLLVAGCDLPVASSWGPTADAMVAGGLMQALQQVNQGLAKLCGEIPACTFFDLDQVAARFGRERWRDERMFLATRLPVAPEAFRSFAQGLLRCASAVLRPARKVLCTDLDNTLWGGVLGEDGIAGIATGAAFPGNAYLAYQSYLKGLAARGIVLAVTSKNNEADVVEAFRARRADMSLALDDFAVRKIGWGDKTQALREIAGELSVGVDSLVFVDDSPVECEAVRRHLPEVAVVEVSATEPWKTVPQLMDTWHFDIISITTDDRNRSQEYKAQAQRAAWSDGAVSREDFLRSLGMVCTFVGAADAPLDRSVQLLAKTNQFNLTTRRHSAAAVLAFAQDAMSQAVAIRVRDRFGDSGVVGLALARTVGDTCHIDSFLLSCRVIGRGVETALLAHVAAHAFEAGARWLEGEFLETKKNQPCRDFYPNHGFSEVESDGARHAYRLNLLLDMPKSPSWLTLEGDNIDANKPRATVLA